jgi:biotin/methionine sulfoxide reductase
MRLSCSAPARRPAPELGAKRHAIVPGTDTAVMLGIAHTLIAERLHDEAFLARYCTGFERLREYVLGAADGVAKTPEWAATICEIPADAIRALARRLAANRSMITVAWSLQRAQRGEQPYWMAIALSALLGQIGLPGGGFGHGYGSMADVGAPTVSLRLPFLPQAERGRVVHSRGADRGHVAPPRRASTTTGSASLPRRAARLLGGRQSVPPPPGPELAAARDRAT